MVKLAAFCRGGYSLNVSRNCPTKPCIGTSRYTWSKYQSQYVFDVIVERSYGSVRRLNSHGRRVFTNCSPQSAKVPGDRCWANTAFQLSYRSATRSPSSEK